MKLIILTNCPALSKSEGENHATLAKTSVHHCSSNNIELVPVGGNFYRVCTLAIIDSGDSDITRIMPEQTGEKKTRKVFLSLNFNITPLKKIMFETGIANILPTYILLVFMLFKTINVVRTVLIPAMSFPAPLLLYRV